MISMNVLLRLAEALPRCYLSESAGTFLITDKHGEMVGTLDSDSNTVVIYSNYAWCDKVVKAVKRRGLNVRTVHQHNTDDIAKVLYGEP